MLDAIYIIFFARYVYLYGCFLDNKEKKIDSTTSIDDIAEKVGLVKDKLDEVIDDIKDAVEENVDASLKEDEEKELRKTSKKNTIKKKEDK